MSQFPKARPLRSLKQPRRPRDWRQRTHVFVGAGQKDWDGEPLCDDCGFRFDHAVHDLNQSVVVEAAEIDARQMGEAETVES